MNERERKEGKKEKETREKRKKETAHKTSGHLQKTVKSELSGGRTLHFDSKSIRVSTRYTVREEKKTQV